MKLFDQNLPLNQSNQLEEIWLNERICWRTDEQLKNKWWALQEQLKIVMNFGFIGILIWKGLELNLFVVYGKDKVKTKGQTYESQNWTTTSITNSRIEVMSQKSLWIESKKMYFDVGSILTEVKIWNQNWIVRYRRGRAIWWSIDNSRIW